jgi:hypothetical protein
VAWAILVYDWRAAFVITGALGLVWVVLWLAFFRSPETHPRLSPAERDLIAAGQEADLAADAARPSIPKLLLRRDFWGIALPRMLAEYFKDHFALRAELIRWQARAKVGWLRSSSSPEVMLGREGWLFHVGEGEVEMFTGAKPFTPEGLEDWRRFLEATRDGAGRRGASLVVTFVPEKQTVYPELMPDGTPFLSVVKGNPQLKNIKVLAVSREMNDSEMAETLRLGGDAYLPKPAHPVQVVMDV